MCPQDIKARADHPWFGKHGRLAIFNKLQLCPVIWILILGLLGMFVFKVIGVENMFGARGSSGGAVGVAPGLGSGGGSGTRGAFLLADGSSTAAAMMHGVRAAGVAVVVRAPGALSSGGGAAGVKPQAPQAAAAGQGPVLRTAASVVAPHPGAVQRQGASRGVVAAGTAAAPGQHPGQHPTGRRLEQQLPGSGAAAAPPSPPPPRPAPFPPLSPSPEDAAAAAQVRAVLSSHLMLFFAWTCVLSAAAGLALLHQVTTCDPGFIRRGGWDPSVGKRSNPGASGAAASSSGPKSAGARAKNGAVVVLGGAAADGASGGMGAAGRGGVENRGGGGGGGAGGAHAVAPEASPLLRTGSDSIISGHALFDCPALWAGHWGQICVTCRIVRPLRAKHCAVTDRCIEVFDHYCPWVGNAIGKRNRHTFLVFLLLELYALASSLGCAVGALRAYVTAGYWSDRLGWVIGFIIVDAFVSISVAVLAVAQASQVARNVTTNELANWHRCGCWSCGCVVGVCVWGGCFVVSVSWFGGCACALGWCMSVLGGRFLFFGGGVRVPCSGGRCGCMSNARTSPGLTPASSTRTPPPHSVASLSPCLLTPYLHAPLLPALPPP